MTKALSISLPCTTITIHIHHHQQQHFFTISPIILFSSLHVSEGAPTEAFDPSPSLAIGEYDLLIVGPGILGRLVAHNWRQEYPGCKVFGQTATTNHHQELTEIGINPSLKWTKASSFKFPYVIFCAPPYQSPDYLGDLRLAASCWNGEGALLFTSSSAPYDCNDNGLCHEDNPVVPMGRSPRTDVLLKAEKIVLEFGDKGAHAYWLDKGIVESRPDHILNLIHYEDAASLSVAILKKQFHGRIFLGCDNHPLSRLHAIYPLSLQLLSWRQRFLLSEICSALLQLPCVS
ncbi:hypothetical protein HKD37_13G037438 [Glycine soja]